MGLIKRVFNREGDSFSSKKDLEKWRLAKRRGNLAFTCGHCHRCGDLLPLLANKKTRKVTFQKCRCGYPNKMESLKAFLSSKTKEYKGEYGEG